MGTIHDGGDEPMTDNPKSVSQTTAYIIYNPRGVELMVCLDKGIAEAIRDRAGGCYWREVPLASDIADLERLRK